jgi:hypothetical protein
MRCDSTENEKVINAFDFVNREIKQKSLIIGQIATNLTEMYDLKTFGTYRMYTE